MPGIFWCNYFGKTLVDFFSKEIILQADWHKTDEMEKGILTMLTDEKSVFSINEEMENKIKKQFRKDSFGDPKTFDFSDKSSQSQIKDMPKFTIRNWN